MQRTDQPTSTTAGPFTAPSISLPKGGGAIRGIGEKFGTNASSGTGSLAVPLAITPGRAGFGPQLSLTYDSGAGNGPFGLGWTLALPSITRKTDQGLPQYNDVADSDVFIISGAEDLVPVLIEDAGQWNRETIERTVDDANYRIQRFRPRIEGLFSRIERWTNLAIGDVHWRSIDRDNVTTLYGRDHNSRIFDPTDPARVFRWLISETHDDRGNVVVYEYKQENSEAVPLSDVHERNRTLATRSAERHIKRIRYGNRVSRLVNPEAALNDWMFEVVFDYGEHDTGNPTPNENSTWLCRHDPFSSYRAGFEVRSYRLCQRVLMFHHFTDEEEVGQNCLVRSTDFTYRNIRNHPDDQRQGHPVASFLASITECGYRRQEGGFLRQTMPPVEFEYSNPALHEELREIALDSLENLPYGIDGGSYQWLDLDGEGASGIVTEQGGAWFYKRNLSPLNARQSEPTEATLAPVELVAKQPSLNDSGIQSQMFLDLAGDGQADLVQFSRPLAGYFERTENSDWSRFVPFESVPSISLGDPNVRFVDLTGDGHADILISEDEVFVWYPSLGEAGFAPANKVAQALDEEAGPRLVFSDPSQSIYLADLSGDGLTDLVRIRNGEVCYWPNLGYGKFGARVTMDNSPWFEAPDQFEQKRILLADIDGSGVTDIVYLGRDRVDLYFNQSGNSWTDPHSLTQMPATDSLSSIAALDLLGNGTACLVWSSSLPGERVRSLRYVDLMGSEKPHLLTRVINNLGVETSIHYAASTSFYLEDKFAGRPWATKLPFPVHVVDRVDTLDRISRNRFVTRYTYHHGYFDGGEREFRGFGMVEQFDTEEFAALTSEGTLPEVTNLDSASHVPPVVTRTWFHTGALIDAGRISRQFEDEYYSEGDASLGEAELNEAQLRSMLLDDTLLPNSVRMPDGTSSPWTITADEALEASRSLKGAILRQEIYGRDGSEAAERPYTVSERNYTIELLQPRGNNQNAVCFTHARETIDFTYERELFDVNGRLLADPRVAHSMVLACDTFGNTTESVSIGYGRRHSDPNPLLTAADRQKQQQTLITYTANRVTNAVLEADDYRTPAPAESQTFELVNLSPAVNEPDVTNLFRFEELLAATETLNDGSHDIPHENIFAEGVITPARRLLNHSRFLYRRDDLTGSLPLSQLHPRAIPFEHYQLAFTAGLLNRVYGERVSNEMLANEGGYLDLDANGNWWSPSGRYFFSINPADTPATELAHASEHFFLPARFSNPFGNSTTVAYDAHSLLPVETRDPLGNTMLSQNDYRVMQPLLVTDANGNRTRAEFNALGLVTGTASRGKVNEQLGDALEDFDPDLTEETILAHLQDPFINAHAILGDAGARLIYDFHAYHRTSNSDNPQPNVIYSLRRETHMFDLLPNQLPQLQHSFTYCDGLGREMQKKIQAEPGPVAEGEPDVERRWVGSAWTIFNNKGKPVREFEPFFSNTHQFEFARAVGVSPILCYDPMGRVVATIHPNHSWQKVVFDPWQQETWEVNDTVLQAEPQNDPDAGDFFRRLPEAEFLPTWRAQRIDGQFGDTPEERAAEQNAAEKASVHAETPALMWLDSLARPFLTIAHNRFIRNEETIEEHHATRVSLDVESNRREVTDALNRIIAHYDYNLLGSEIRSASMDAGERWKLSDVSGGPIRIWDSRGHVFRTEYDELRRPTRSFVSGVVVDTEILFEQTTYGESQGELLNHRGRVFQVFDGAGIATNDAYDFKGNLLQASRQLLVNYHNAVDWHLNPSLDSEVFVSRTTYDALNRPVTIVSPDNSTTRPTYNEANLLERLETNLRGADAITTFVNNIEYDAAGRRRLIEYGNGARTTYDYDPLTHQLTNLSTLRGVEPLQNLSYTYDPAGNVTGVRDQAQQTVYFNNQVASPDGDYTYDAIHRLIAVAGREHIGQVSQPQSSWNDEFRVNLDHPHDGQAMRRYAEQYEYDAAGNILQVLHRAANGDWTRTYAYDEPSLVEPAHPSNRLSHTEVGNLVETHTHDAHGNVTRMSQLPLMQWDYLDRLQVTSQQVVNNGTPETTYYVYDATGERLRKVTDRQAGNGVTPTRRRERIYLFGFEIYREYEVDGVTVTLERESLHVMDDQQRLALVETRTHGDDGSPSQVIRYQLSNHLGSAATELDQEANIISYEEYYPYGSTSYKAGRSDIEVSLKRYRYTARERDEETGFSYHGARYYACWLGRWTSADPSGIEASPNVYAYVSANPIKFHDPDGRKKAQRTYGGLRFAPESQINAQQMLALIKSNPKLEPWMKNLFVVKGNELRLRTLKPRLPVGVDWERDVPQWFKNTVTAIYSRQWYISTGTSLVSDKATASVIPDIDEPSGRNKTPARTDPKITFGYTDPSANDQHLNLITRDTDKPAEPKNPASRRPHEGLIIMTNRLQHSADKDTTVARSNEAIVETFFHELGAHAGIVSSASDADRKEAWKKAGHKSEKYEIGLYPMSEADQRAKEVNEFFDLDFEAENVDYAKALGEVRTSVGVITDLNQVESISEERRGALKPAIDLIIKRRAAATAVPAP